MISNLQPHLLFGLAGPWVDTLLAVAALAGIGYAWRCRSRSAAAERQPEELNAGATDAPSPAPTEPEQEISFPPSWIDGLTSLPDLGTLRTQFRPTLEEPSPLTLLTITVRGRTADQSTDSEPGDRALVEVAHTVRSVLRASDTCVRSTTGQLMAVLPGLDADTSGNLVTRVKHAVESLTLLTRSGGEIRLAVQVGRACVPQDGADLDALLDAARKNEGLHREPRKGSAMERLSRAAPIIPN